VVAADFKVPIFEHFRPPPFTTVRKHEFARAVAFATSIRICAFDDSCHREPSLRLTSS